MPALARILAQENIQVSLLEEIQPSIEDVFVSLAQENKNGPQNQSASV
jgi:hypothetical protein